MRPRRSLLLAATALASAAALASPYLGRDPGGGTPRLSPQPAFAGDPRVIAGPRVALLATPPGGSHTSLYLVTPGDTGATLAPAATLTHLEGAAVRGATVPGSDTIAVVADTLAARDLSFAASLFRVAPHHPPELVCDRVVHSSRPLVTASGRVFVSRGVAGPVTDKGYRVDALTVDEIDLATGATRPILSHAGYVTFLAGAHEREILVYRVSAHSADLVGVDPDTGATRVITELLPFARDFSVDPARGAIVFLERDPHDSRAWTIDRIDLASGARTRLHQSASMSLAPFAWPGGGVAWSVEGRGGLALLGKGRPLSPAPLGAGVDLVRALSTDGAWAALLHTVAGELPQPFAVDTRTGQARALPAPGGARIEIAGFLGAAGGVK